MLAYDAIIPRRTIPFEPHEDENGMDEKRT
jgi:hypothetical protein